MITGRYDFDAAQLSHNLDTFDDRVQRAIEATIRFHASRVESQMKVDAPWNDNTGLARGSLFARYNHDGDGHGLVLGGGAPYQIYLETRFNGRYAVITPALQRVGPEIMATLTQITSRLGHR